MTHFWSVPELKIVLLGEHEGAVGVEELIRRDLNRFGICPDYIVGALAAATFQRVFVPPGINLMSMQEEFGTMIKTYDRLQATSATPARRCTVYGIGKIKYILDQSVLIARFLSLFPAHDTSQEPSRKTVVEVVKKEVKSQLIFNHPGPDVPFDTDTWNKATGNNIIFRSIADYKNDEAARRGEINASD